MPRRKGLLNVEGHLEHIKIILDGLEKYGMCPLIEAEIKKASFINDILLKNYEEKKAKRRNPSG